MIFFDVTKARSASHRSGLTRVSERLRDALASRAKPAVFDRGQLRAADTTSLTPARDDWFLTGELFTDEERPGFDAFIATRPCRLAAIFHDAIPLKHPHITWPQSVARHPRYMKTLARFDRVWAVSQASRDELLGFWRWQGIETPPPVDVLALGADAAPTAPRPPPEPKTHNSKPKTLLCLGIVEPRKNQSFLLEVCDRLWREGLAFELHVIGRVNPHFGPPIIAKLKALQRTYGGCLHYHGAASDAEVARLFAAARASAFPTIAEGCGLPLLESLAHRVPCVHSDLPVLQENAAGGGCLAAAVNDHAAWSAGLRRILTDDALHQRLVSEASARTLPTWSAAADTLARALG